MGLTPYKKLAGVLAPLFALRTERDLGVGDVASLAEFVDWCADHGFGLVQILPINETGADNSPYNAVSSAAIDPATLQTDPDGIKELLVEDFEEVLAGYDMAALRTGAVDYPVVKRLKHELLYRAFQVFEAKLQKGVSRAKKFHAWCRDNPWVESYSLFRALMERHGNEQWDLWPEGVRTAGRAATWLEGLHVTERKEFRRRMQYFAYVQWVAYTQWGKLHKHCTRRRIALMGDIPIGVSYYSADVFADPEVFDLDWSGGAPPERVFQTDPFTVKWGQNWGVPLYDWEVIRERGDVWWKKRVALVREVFHLFRIDHVLGFYRIYAFPWRPERNDEFLPLDPDEARERTGGRLPGFLPLDDDSWENREANRRRGERILRVLLEEVGEYRLIGEDLGVVPEYVRPSLASLGVAGFKIPMWEKGWDGRLIPGSSYQRLSLATYATHDHPPVAAFWREWADVLREAEGGDSEAVEAAEEARSGMQALMDFAGIPLKAGAIDYTDGIREALLGALFQSNAWLAIPMITDVFGVDERFNVPGAVDASNWSHRMSKTIAQWRDDPVIAPKMEVVQTLIRKSGRAR